MNEFRAAESTPSSGEQVQVLACLVDHLEEKMNELNE